MFVCCFISVMLISCFLPAAVSVTLTVVLGQRYMLTNKFMPAGMITTMRWSSPCVLNQIPFARKGMDTQESASPCVVLTFFLIIPANMTTCFASESCSSHWGHCGCSVSCCMCDNNMLKLSTRTNCMHTHSLVQCTSGAFLLVQSDSWRKSYGKKSYSWLSQCIYVVPAARYGLLIISSP